MPAHRKPLSQVAATILPLLQDGHRHAETVAELQRRHPDVDLNLHAWYRGLAELMARQFAGRHQRRRHAMRAAEWHYCRTQRGASRLLNEEQPLGDTDALLDPTNDSRGAIAFRATMREFGFSHMGAYNALRGEQRIRFERLWTARMKLACAEAGVPIPERSVFESYHEERGNRLRAASARGRGMARRPAPELEDDEDEEFAA